MIRVAALILAAGKATRFRAAAGPDGPASKLLAMLDGEPLVRHVARAALASNASEVIVATGHAGDAVAQALGDLPVRIVHNARFEEGLATSLQCALAAAPEDVQAALVLLGDMPRATPALLDRLIGALAANPDVDAVAPVHGGQRGNPVLLSRRLFPAVMQLKGDQGARRLLDSSDLRVLDVPVDDDAVVIDIDTPEALANLRKRPV